jgi:hypothetical protein
MIHLYPLHVTLFRIDAPAEIASIRRKKIVEIEWKVVTFRGCLLYSPPGKDQRWIAEWLGNENCLEEKGIFTVRDLLQSTPDTLLSIANFGEKTLEEVYLALEKIGYNRPWRKPR